MTGRVAALLLIATQARPCSGRAQQATSVHSYLIGESPSLYDIHFGADGPLPDVLRGLRAALDAAR
jgi:hypothetical protein